MSHVRFFTDEFKVLTNTFIQSVQNKAHWQLLGPVEETKRSKCLPVPLFNILLDLPALEYTAWLIISIDQSTNLEQIGVWLTNHLLNNVNPHMDVLFLIQLEDPLLSFERLINQQTNDFDSMKKEFLPKLSNVISQVPLYRNRYYYLFAPEVLLRLNKNKTSSTGSSETSSKELLGLDTEEERYFHMFKCGLESISPEWLALVVGWVASSWFHVLPSLSEKQDQELRLQQQILDRQDQLHMYDDRGDNQSHDVNNVNNVNLKPVVYCDLDWTPRQFISVLILDQISC